MELIKNTIIKFIFNFIYSLLLIYTVFVINIVVPKSEEIAREKLRSSDADYFVALIKPKKFNDTIKA